MSHIFRRGRTVVHALIPGPPAAASHGLGRDVFRGRAVQHRAYSATQQPRTVIAASIAELPGVPKLAEHLNHVFAPLQFPPELAARILTHQSHKHSALTSNTRLSFIGRRVLQSYLLLFLDSSSGLKPTHDFEHLMERALNTYVLGEHVGPQWQLGKVMKWAPATSNPSLANDPTSVVHLGKEATRSIGLYKVEGIAVEALVGGVFHQFGGSIAHKLFHTRLLPHLLLPGKSEGLPEAFHADVLKICKQMGGPQSDLTSPNQLSNDPQQS